VVGPSIGCRGVVRHHLDSISGAGLACGERLRGEWATPSTRFDWVLAALATVYTVLLLVVTASTFFADGLNVVTAADGMFANPYASGVSIDVIVTYVILAAWVVYEVSTAACGTGGWRSCSDS
jgi:uncharacterized protein DUF2834